MTQIIKTDIVYYLEKIYNAITGLGGTVLTAQSDWNETDGTSPKFIANKPTIAQADWNQTSSSAADYIKNKPTVYPCLIVNGHKESAFIPDANQPSKNDCIACINAGGVVYLVNKVRDSEIHKELVISVDTVAKTFTTANMTW